jgi:N-acetylneuraminic acid mutarotase
MRTAIVLAMLFSVSAAFSQTEDTWASKATVPDYPGRSWAAGFSINGFGYVGLGTGQPNVKDLWQYNPASNQWTKKANFPGTAQAAVAVFVIGDVAYFGQGYTPEAYTNELWAYNSVTNTWTKKKSFPGEMTNVMAFAINGRGYYVCGSGPVVGPVYNYFWEYDPNTDNWTKMEDFPGAPRAVAGTFKIGDNKAYLVGGVNLVDNSFNFLNELWEYNASTKVWTQKANLPVSICEMVAVGMGGKGYVISGRTWDPDFYNTDVYEYDNTTNAWSTKAAFKPERIAPTGFVIENKIFVGAGQKIMTGDHPYTPDFQEYTGTSIVLSPTSDFSADEKVCLGTTTTVTFSGSMPQGTIYHWEAGDAEQMDSDDPASRELKFNSAGEKSVSLYTEYNGVESSVTTKIITVLEMPEINFTVTGAGVIACSGDTINILYTGTHTEEIVWDFKDAEVISGSGFGPYALKFESGNEKSISIVAKNGICQKDSAVHVVSLTETIASPALCIVTVDEVSGKNKLIWRYDDSRVKSFSIYRETNTAGDFTLTSSVAGDARSYLDLDSSPAERASRYRISATDSCDRETALSETHKTMHLTINKGQGNSWNLIWDQYEGFEFGSYSIERRIDLGEFSELTTIASNLTSFTDLDVPAEIVEYRIGVVNAQNCSPISESVARSNTERNEVVTSSEVKVEHDIIVYPNPVSDELMIEYFGSNGGFTLRTAMGNVIVEGRIHGATRLDVSSLASGLYFLVVSNSSATKVTKVQKK